MKLRIACLGSGSGESGELMYDAMDRVGQLLAMKGVTVLTGGFGGVGMEAPARGARQAGGKCVGYTLCGKEGNPFLTDVVDCSRSGASPEVQYGIRLGNLLSADGFIIAAGGGPGTMVELMAIINLNVKGFWEKPKKIAVLKPLSCNIPGWDESMLDQLHAWRMLSDSDKARSFIKIVSTPQEAVDWVLN